jgi:uncharacterized membrane protein YjgN (DUF898 family)
MSSEPTFGSDSDPESDTPTVAATPHFSGSGAEYFRIWIVNLLLTVATLGIYSAWAKTRRLQYFYRNTQLNDATFDFTGDPMAILRGRIVAVVLVALYQYAFGFSMKAGAATVAVLLLGLPFLMRAALRFRLSNTVYRGLPFGFSGSIMDAYRVYLPPIALLFVPSTLLALFPGAGWVGLIFLLFLAWPLMHGAMKAYQHRHLAYGDQAARLSVGTRALAKPYLKMLGLLVLWFILVTVGVVIPVVMLGTKSGPSATSTIILVLAIGAMIYPSFLVSAVYLMVRIDNLAWSSTTLAGVSIASTMRVRTYLRMQVVNVLLTIITLGLYRPFAAVRTWKYRLAHVRIDAPDGFERATMHVSRPAAAAVGDGAADFLGVDLSW